jgi:DnaJ-class molecular chaperone
MVQGLRRMLWLCADSAALADADYYEVLGVSPTANGTQIADACAVLRTLIDPTNEPPGVSFATAARFKDLCRLLDEIEATLIDTGRRARYDGSRRRR